MVKVRVPGPKPKRVVLKPRGLNSLNWQEVSAPRKTRKSYTREFKLQALSMLQETRVNDDGEVVPIGTTQVCRYLGVSKKMLREWHQ